MDILSSGNRIVAGPLVFTRPYISDFAPQKLEFTSLRSGTYRLIMLIMSQTAGFGTNVDNFALRAVPEPGTVAFLCGLAAPGAILLLRRRRK